MEFNELLVITNMPADLLNLYLDKIRDDAIALGYSIVVGAVALGSPVDQDTEDAPE